MKRTVCLAALCLVVILARGDEGWTDDFEAAKAKAEKEGKDLLLDFTGSDWCGWCIKLHNEVFDQDAFKKEAPKSFILVELDFPRKKELPEKVKAQNEKLSGELEIQGYPTVYLMDSKGRPYARTGYQAGGAEKYLQHLAELRKVKTSRDENFVKAEKASGLEKAKLLDKALSDLEEADIRNGYDDVIAQIVAADPDNKGGLKLKYAARKKIEEVIKVAESGKIDDAIKMADDYIKENTALTGRSKQDVLFLKAMLLNSKGDKEQTLTALQAAKDADPDSAHGKRLTEIIEKVKTQK